MEWKTQFYTLLLKCVWKLPTLLHTYYQVQKMQITRVFLDIKKLYCWSGFENYQHWCTHITKSKVCKLPGLFRQKKKDSFTESSENYHDGKLLFIMQYSTNLPGQIAGARAISANNSLPASGGTNAHSAGTNASTWARSLGEQTISEPATPESGGIDADMEGSNMEAYSTPKPPL